MFFKNYQYFLAIVEYGGLTRAAEALYISQPSLSKYLSRLEANLGVELFDHSASPLKLTYAGERYYDYVKRLQLMEQRLTREFEDIRGRRLRRDPAWCRPVARSDIAAAAAAAIP